MSPAPPRDSATPPDRFRGRHIKHPPSHGPAPVIPRDREGSGGSEMVPDGGRMKDGPGSESGASAGLRNCPGRYRGRDRQPPSRRGPALVLRGTGKGREGPR